jgi:ABC-type antimicrobial peptide transport system permease subunit
VALGADRKIVLSMVVRSAYSLVGIGLVIGILLFFVMSRLLDSKLYGVSGHNPVVLGGAIVLLAIFAFVAVTVRWLARKFTAKVAWFAAVSILRARSTRIRMTLSMS